MPHDAAYWAAVTKGMDFSVEDRVDPNAFNPILWQGLMGNQPYPVAATGLDLRVNRGDLLAHYRTHLEQQSQAVQSNNSGGGSR